MTGVGRGRIGLPEIERGRILSLGPDSAPLAGPAIRVGGATEAGLHRFAGAFLLLTLPLFGQLFHYLIDLGPFYYLSKAWPFLTLPLAAYGVFAVSTRFHALYLLTIAYALGVTPVLSMVWLGNALVDAFTTTIKVWPLTYFFSMLGCLAIFRPTAATIRRSVLQLGIGTFVAMWLLWALVPAGYYASDPTISKLFMYEIERGYRIYMPMTFGIVVMFYLASRLADEPRLWMVLTFLGMLASMVLIYKQRLAITATVLVVAWTFVNLLPTLLRSLFVLIGVVVAAAAAAAVVTNLDALTAFLGGSLSVRQHSTALVTSYLVNEPLRWIFGVGGTTRFGGTTLSEIFGSTNFYLADLGWLGVLFEYGLVGSLLILALYIVVIRLPATVAAGDRKDAAMAGALRAYVLYLLITSTIYSAVFVPGELAAVSALFLYLHRGPGAERRES